MKKDKVNFEYNQDLGIAICYIEEYGEIFIGTAACHPDDKDVMSKFTGCEIANCRAYIELLRYEKKSILEPQLKALKQLFYSINKSKKFNKESYEARAIWRQIRLKEAEIADIKAEIIDEKQYLKEYIEKKEELHQRLRAQRNKVKN